MKKVFLSSLVLLVMVAATTSVSAQEFKKFRVGLGLGFGSGSGNGSGGGVLVALEPGYRVSDQILVNLRLESALIGRGYSNTVPSTGSIDITSIGSYTLNSQYYFSNGTFRPFAGIGLGLYSLGKVKIKDNNQPIELGKDESKFGFYPRVGFDLGHFNVTVDYNIVGSTSIDGVNGSFSNNYFGVRLGAFFGGGRTK